MLYLSILSLAETTAPEGGLFDFNATLPLMAIQFLLLMAVLNNIFYKPVTNILDERNDYIRNSLTQAVENLKKANDLTNQYESELVEARKSVQAIINSTKKQTQDEIAANMQDVQQQINVMITDASNELNAQKEKALKTLEDQVDILSQEIKTKLLSGQTV